MIYTCCILHMIGGRNFFYIGSKFRNEFHELSMGGTFLPSLVLNEGEIFNEEAYVSNRTYDKHAVASVEAMANLSRSDDITIVGDAVSPVACSRMFAARMIRNLSGADIREICNSWNWSMESIARKYPALIRKISNSKT